MPKTRILVVEDEPAVLAVCVRALSRRGYEVEAVDSAPQALARLRTTRFNLLLTDVRMPEMDGIELLERVRQFDPHLTSLILTGHGTLSTAIEAIKLGVNGFLLKPFTLEELFTAVERALERERLLQENLRLQALMPLFEVSRGLMAEHDLETLLPRILRAAREGTASEVSWLLVEPEPGAGVRVLPGENDRETAAVLAAGWSTLARFFDHCGEPLRWSPGYGARNAEEASASPMPQQRQLLDQLERLQALLAQPHSIAVPLIVSGRLVGALLLARGVPFTESDLDWAGVLASQAATAIDNRWAHEKARQAIRTRDEFLSIAAHELKTPIAIIQAYAELLRESEADLREPVEATAVAAMGRQAANLGRLVKEMLEFSRLQVASLELSREFLDLGELVAEVLREMQVLSTRHRLVLRVRQSVLVEADRGRIEQVVQNLVSNAIRFSPQGGPITVCVSASDGEAVVSVQDQGIGIPAARQGRLFERFYRAHTGTMQDLGGFGIGLHVSRQIVKRHLGEMWVESKAGRGSTFSFSLPLSGAGGSGARAASPPA